MDDLLTSADDLESGRKLQEQLVSLLRGAGMELHKCSTSNPLTLPDSMCQDKDLSYSSSTETLGLLWKPHPDSFAFKISPMTSNCASLIVRKKSVISTISRIFDPLGLIGPYKELEPYDTSTVEGDDLFLQELKETSDIPLCALLKTFEPLDIISNCSSFTKLQRVIAWCKRFIENARHPRSQTMGPLTL
ncbi:integrase catalytic domain-containing protein [Trichonephila clavata]|uniref:Integrase catalytic domain-containing protein n=1 Tax=Trichonephila clavata TaxID=2740835 RepID=A0A8X6LT19_TRICU|nr:integrase catalytic domain-containing protein [Trichonephila clavata]